MKISEIIQKRHLFNIDEIDVKTILSNVLGLQLNEIFLNSERELTKNELGITLKSMGEKKNGKPISKFFNTKFFWNHDFFVNNNVLDPRGDSEILIESVVEKFQNMKSEKLNILELGTGSGCLVLSILKEFKNSTAVAVDLSKKSLDVARFNAVNLGLHSRIKFIQNNWNDNINEKFDIIISNPPYIKTNDIDNLSREVKFFDPHLALDGGKNGLECYKYLAKNLKKNCHSGTSIFLEIGFGQFNEVNDIFTGKNFTFIGSKNDLNGIIRVVMYGKY